MTENENIYSRLKNVGNPMFLLKMSYDIRKFLQEHQVDFKQTGDFDRVFLEVSDEAFECYDAGVAKLELMPEKGSLVRLSRESLIEIAENLQIEFDKKNDESLLSSLLTELRKVKHIKEYKTILMIIDSSFQTNLKMTEFVKVILNQL